MLKKGDYVKVVRKPTSDYIKSFCNLFYLPPLRKLEWDWSSLIGKIFEVTSVKGIEGYYAVSVSVKDFATLEMESMVLPIRALRRLTSVVPENQVGDEVVVIAKDDLFVETDGMKRTLGACGVLTACYADHVVVCFPQFDNEILISRYESLRGTGDRYILQDDNTWRKYEDCIKKLIDDLSEPFNRSRLIYGKPISIPISISIDQFKSSQFDGIENIIKSRLKAGDWVEKKRTKEEKEDQMCVMYGGRRLGKVVTNMLKCVDPIFINNPDHINMDEDMLGVLNTCVVKPDELKTLDELFNDILIDSIEEEFMGTKVVEKALYHVTAVDTKNDKVVVDNERMIVDHVKSINGSEDYVVKKVQEKVIRGDKEGKISLPDLAIRVSKIMVWRKENTEDLDDES